MVTFYNEMKGADAADKSCRNYDVTKTVLTSGCFAQFSTCQA